MKRSGGTLLQVMWKRVGLWVAVAVAVSALGGAAGRWLLDSLNDPVPAYLEALHENADPHPPSALPPARRVVVVLIDGLGEDAFRTRLVEGALEAPTWRVSLDTGVPSLSRPVYHAILTGVPQWVSGIRSNNYTRGRADSVPDRVRAQGGKVAWMLETVPWFNELFGVRGDIVVEGPEVRTTEAFERVWAKKPDLLVLHLTETDSAGHSFGAASEEYAQASRAALETVTSFRKTAGADEAIWFIGADHGHMPKGGHGGDEMEVRRVMWIALGGETGVHHAPAPREAQVTSLAPTFARALGVAPPRESLEDGLPFFEASFGPPFKPDHDRAEALAREAFLHHAMVFKRESFREIFAFGFVGLAFVVAAMMRGWRVLDESLPSVIAALAFVFGGPGLSLSAIRTHAWFLTHAALVMTAFAALSWIVVRRRASPIYTAIFSVVFPAAALVLTSFSIGAADPAPVEAVLWPSLGLVPATVCAGIAVAEIARAAFLRVWPRRRIAAR